LKDREFIAANLVFCLTFGSYVTLSAPGPQFGDNGEFLSAAWNLGICHNPGYPVQSVIGHLISRFIPLASIAFRVNICSALAGAAACSMLTLIMLRLKTGIAPALFSVSLFAFSPLFWAQTVSAEVYTYDALAVLMNLWILLNAGRNRGSRALMFFAFSLGFGLIVHLSQILYLPGYLIAWGLADGRNQRKKPLPALVFLLLALSVCVYLPIRATHLPAPNFANPQTWNPFFGLVSGTEHRHFVVLNQTFSGSLGRIGEYFRTSIIESISYPGLAASFAGMILLFKARKEAAFAGTWIFAACLIYAVFLNQVSMEATPFGIPAVAMLAVFIAVLISALIERISPASRPARRFLSLLCILAAAANPVRNAVKVDRSGDLDPMRFAHLQTDVLPSGAAFLVRGDNDLFINLYLRSVEKLIPDVFWADMTGSLGMGPLPPPSKYHSMALFYQAFVGVETRLDERTGERLFYSWRPSWEYRPVGLVFTPKHVDPAAVRLGDELAAIYFPDSGPGCVDFQHLRIWARVRLQQAYRACLLSEDSVSVERFDQAMKLAGGITDIIIDGGDFLMYQGRTAEAIELLQRAVSQDPGSEAGFFLLMQAYTKTGNSEKAAEAEAKYRQLLKRHL
jgi:hypothetical protein